MAKYVRMKFRKFLILHEADGLGAPPGIGGGMPPAPGMPPSMGPGAPPMGGGMGGMAPPMPGMDGMGMGGMGGGMAGPTSEPPIIPRNADVWDVLDAIFNHKNLNHDILRQQQEDKPKAAPPGGMPMGGDMPSPQSNSGQQMPPMGAGGPFLQG